ncbi:unnamed protein product [Pedinophyceae sp. YPF-701]|nr:unnamed protein product [Pedinophyceae sp. YPF-701]
MPKPEVADYINKLIKENPVMVFSKSYCPACSRAKRAITGTKGGPEKMKVLEMDGLPECDDLQDELLSMTGGRTVPRVFIGGKFVGGGDETAALARAGKLEAMIAAA